MIWLGRGTTLLVAVLAPVLGLSTARGTPAPEPRVLRPVQFNRDIRPILSGNCFFCHGPDKGHRKADLRLDVRDSALADKAIVPGKPEASELWKRITTKDPDDVMPPPDTHKQLKPAEIERLRRWISEGATYQPHWAYVPVRRPSVPAVGDATRPANPVDNFVLAGLKERGLEPSPPADRRTLLRRLALDLVGLPPAPQELAAFEQDRGTNAYAAQIDRLLASPHFGERMAVPWLDVARFADTVGYHGDQNHNVFPYRDYVIDAFNRNKPFDQFTIEQLAGDLLPNPTTEQLVATGFNRLNMVTREGGAQPKEYLAKYMADRVRAVGTVWLGSTLGCTECHDHKFDPFTARDFYSMGAFFADVKQWGVYNDYSYSPNPELKGFSNEHPFPPEIAVESPFLVRRALRLRQEMGRTVEEAGVRLAASRDEQAAYRAWRTTAKRFLIQHPNGWQPARLLAADAMPAATPKPAVVSEPPLVSTAENTAPQESSPKGRKSTKSAESPASLSRRIAPPVGWLAALRMDLAPVVKPKEPGVKWSRKALRRVFVSAVLISAGKETPLDFHFADALRKEPSYRNGEKMLGIVPGWDVPKLEAGEVASSVWELAEPVRIADGDVVRVTAQGEEVASARLFTSPFAAFGSGLAPSPIADSAKGMPARTPLAAYLRRAVAAPTGSHRRGLEEVYLLSTGWAKDEARRLREWARDVTRIGDGRAPSLFTTAIRPYTVRVLPRGNWQDENGEVVSPSVPRFLSATISGTAGADRRLTRLDLARWITARGNPLTARVLVNRVWRHLFGTGLSAGLDDLGAQGEPPSHPELLDWLAAELMESNWDVKRLIRLIVMSNTYRQDSTLRPGLSEIDPGNRLLARQSQRRLDAEFVRDNALAVAGLLNLEVGGPSAFPYQPIGYYENLQFPTRDWSPDRDERQYRRGLYVHWQRTFLHPMLANFDAPSREECAADRPPSNTPQQALALLNDATFVEAARVFAARMLEDRILDDDARLGRLFERALGRAPRRDEASSLLRLLGNHREHFAAHTDDARRLTAVGFARPAGGLEAAEHAAWTSVARVVLNMYESITRL